MKLRNLSLKYGISLEDSTSEMGGAVASEITEADLDNAAEMGEAINDVDNAEMISEEIHETATGLESAIVAMESALQNGGMCVESAQFMKMHVNNLAGRFGFETAMPSMESFGLESEKMYATQISIEGVKDTLSSVWEATKRAFARAIKFIKDLWKRAGAMFTSKNKRTEKRIDVVLALPAPKEEPKDLQLPFKPADGGLNIVKLTANTTKFLNDIIDDVSIPTANFLMNITKIDIGASDKEVKALFDRFRSAFPHKSEVRADQGVEVLVSDFILSGQAQIAFKNEENTSYIETLKLSKAEVEIHDKDDKDNTMAVTYDELRESAKQMKKILDKVNYIIAQSEPALKMFEAYYKQEENKPVEKDQIKLVKMLSTAMNGLNGGQTIAIWKAISTRCEQSVSMLEKATA